VLGKEEPGKCILPEGTSNSRSHPALSSTGTKLEVKNMNVLEKARMERELEMERLKKITRKRVREGKINYGLLGNWAVEHFSD